MNSVYPGEFNNEETYVKHSFIQLTIMFRLFILIVKNMLMTAFLRNAMFS